MFMMKIDVTFVNLFVTFKLIYSPQKVNEK